MAMKDRNRTIAFESEALMEDAFETVASPWAARRSAGLHQQFIAPVGRPDFILCWRTQRETVAIELKLKNWRKALSQAFRYRMFANRSVVVMDGASRKLVEKHLDEFRRANVGLFFMESSGAIDARFVPRRGEPFVKAFESRVLESLAADCEEAAFRSQENAESRVI